MRRIQALQGTIRALLDADFDAFFLQDPARPAKPALLVPACAVVDVLGPDVRAQLVDRYAALELKEYRRIFAVRPASRGKPEENEAAGLDNISRRFAWFRRLLNTHDQEAARVFPPEWRVGWVLTSRFVDVTRFVTRVLYVFRP